MKTKLTICVLLLPLVSLGQQLTYKEWKEQAKTNIRLLPEYGNAKKTKDQNEADEEFIQASLKQDGTREKASENMIKFGFDYLYKGDFKTAMYRFNQAWLLNPKNENVYWGFGAVYFMFLDFQSAKTQYNKGLLLNPRSSNLLTDKASICLAEYNQKGTKTSLDSAIVLFIHSYQIDSKNQNTLFKLSVSYFLKNDCANASKYFNECTKLGGAPLTQEYVDAIKQKCGG